MNIYAKLTLLCVLLVVFTSSVLFFFINRQLERTFQEELLSNIAQQSEQTVSNIDRFIFSRLNEIRMAAKNPYFRISDISEEELMRRLQELENLNDLYYSFSYFNNDRIRLADSKNLSIGQQHSNKLYWKQLSPERPAVMDISVSESVGRPVLHFATLVNDYYEEKPIGVLVGRVLVNELYRILGNISIGADSTRNLDVTLVNKDGVVLYSNSESGTDLSAKFEGFEKLMSQTGTGDQVDLVKTEDQLFFVANGRGYQNYSGNEWTLIVSISKDEAFLPLTEIQNQLLWLILTVLGIAIILALIVAHFFVRPIVRLSKAAEDIAHGKFNTDIKINTRDEVGKLATQLTNASQILINRLDEQKKLNQKLEDQKDEMASQKQLLEQANRQVKDSIIYAQRIQRSILPELSVMSKLVKDAFVFYEPKDVVSGDFYWFERVRQGRNEYLVIACADCTGHGVPGAIMSIMGSNQLTNIIYYQNYIDPNKILARLDKVIKFELQREVGNQNRDGLEIGLCVINLDDLTMEFAGAGIPLYLIRKGTQEIVTYKSPKYMIGGIEGDEKEVGSKLSKEIIQLEAGDKIYLSSDGYQDQFGGSDDKKFMSKNFKKLLEDSSSKTMTEQSTIIEDNFNTWKKDTPQTDDVVVIGVEV